MKVIHKKVAGDSPQINLPVEKLLHDSLLSLNKDDLVNSAHDVSEGGIACCLAECCIIDDEKMLGAEVDIPIKTRTDFSLFSESQSRIIVSASPNNKEKFESKLKEFNQPFTYLGKAGGERFKINDGIDLTLNSLAELYFNTIPNIMNSEK